jgi:hypothetical protein
MPTMHITRKAAFSVAAVLAIALSPVSSRGQANVNVVTWHNDNGRTGQNIGEQQLSISSINTKGFGRLCRIPLPSSPQQEQVYAQPVLVEHRICRMFRAIQASQVSLVVISAK